MSHLIPTHRFSVTIDLDYDEQTNKWKARSAALNLAGEEGEGPTPMKAIGKLFRQLEKRVDKDAAGAQGGGGGGGPR